MAQLAAQCEHAAFHARTLSNASQGSLTSVANLQWHQRLLTGTQDKDDLRRKQVRLTREGTDPVSSSLAVPSTARETTEGRVIVTQEDIVQPTAGGPEAFPSAQIEETASYDHATISVEREGQDPLATSLPLPDAQKSLAGFLADYGSGSDDSEPGA